MPEEEQLFARPTNVLLVVDQDVYDRLGSVVWHLGVGMVDEPVRMTILARTASYPSGDSIGPYPVINLPPGWMPWSKPDPEDLLKRIGGDRPDIVHCMSAALAKWMQPVVKAWGSRLLVHITDSQDAKQFGSLSATLQAHAVPINATTRHAAATHRHVNDNRVHLIPLGLPAEKEAACLNEAERVPAVITTAPLERGCGLEIAFQALRAIAQEGREVQLFIMATGSAERFYRRLTNKMDLLPWVTFAGRMGNWAAHRDAVRGGDLFLLPCTHQRFTINSLIAMAAGLAVLAPNGTTEDYLIDGQTAALFDSEDPKSLTRRWLELLDDRATTRLLGERALDHVRAHYQASTMAASLGRLYRTIRDQAKNI